MRLTLFLLTLAFLAPVAQAATPNECEGGGTDAIRATAPSERFHVPASNNQVVLDKETGLLWARCPLGYALNRGTCEAVQGETASFAWGDALAAVVALKGTDFLGAGFTDGWRLPNVKELASIVERRCNAPALNGNVFPGHLSAYYWSATPVPQLSVAAGQNWEEQVWAVNMKSGAVVTLFKGDPNDATTERGLALPVRELTDAEFQDWLSR